MIPVFRGSVHEGKLRLDDRPSFDDPNAAVLPEYDFEDAA